MESKENKEKSTYLFGPVPSRRLGLSLGVDLVPFKTCSLDCVYCQLGRDTTEKTTKRKEYVPIELVLGELKKKIDDGLNADFITLSGSGEPTLNLKLGELIDEIKKITNIPVAVLTNGTLLIDKGVRAACAKADVVLPSLDAGDEETFQKINRPHSDVNIEKLVKGLCAFRKEFDGQIWLEVFLLDGFNTEPEQIAKIRKLVELIEPDKIQLNTAVRLTTQSGIKKLNAAKMQAIAGQFGEKCEVIADFSPQKQDKKIQTKAEDVLSMLKRRPCSLDDICAGLGISRNEAIKYISYFQNNGAVDSEKKGQIVFFKATNRQ
ncbi:MAG: radical SAM protein [Planctomycetes bacterium]|nr:radical SAM protein [Planctomycetota bacterium]MCK5472578.1 radical SAM protein [Planctomycetota bacterium]